MTTDTPGLCADKRADLRECLMKLKGFHLKMLNAGLISQYEFRWTEHLRHRITDCIGVQRGENE